MRQMGAEIKKHVNKRYRLLELDLDGVYKRMLLLKKKKYAAILADHMPDGSVKETLEKKGIDIGASAASRCCPYACSSLSKGVHGRRCALVVDDMTCTVVLVRVFRLC